MKTNSSNYEGKNAILLINLRATLGGATKRYVNLFNYISKENKNFYLIINKGLYDKFLNENSLVNNKNIIKLDIKESINKSSTTNNNFIRKIKKKKKFILLRQIKNFILRFKVWLSFVKEIWPILKEHNFQYIYSIYTGGIWIWPLKYFHHFNLIHSFNDSLLSHTSKNILMFFNSEYWVLKNSDKIDFLSMGIAKRLEKKIGKFEDKKKFITPNSFINFDYYYPEPPKDNTVIFLSRMDTGKNPKLFIESIKLFSRNYPEFSYIKFYIIGGGALSNEVKEKISKTKLTNIKFMGEISDPWKYLRKSKVFVSLQEKENYPSQSLIEAMACENAIIASDVGETHLLVTSDVGVRVKLEASEISNGIKELFANPKDLLKREQNAREKVINIHNYNRYSKYFYSLFQN